MIRTKIVVKLKTHFMFHNYFRKSPRLRENVKKYSTAGQATDENTAHAHCMLYT